MSVRLTLFKAIGSSSGKGKCYYLKEEEWGGRQNCVAHKLWDERRGLEVWRELRDCSRSPLCWMHASANSLAKTHVSRNFWLSSSVLVRLASKVRNTASYCPLSSMKLGLWDEGEQGLPGSHTTRSAVFTVRPGYPETFDNTKRSARCSCWHGNCIIKGGDTEYLQLFFRNKVHYVVFVP